MLRRILLLGLLALTGCSAPLEKPPAAPLAAPTAALLPISPLSAKPAPELIDSKLTTAQAEPIIAEAEPIIPLAADDQQPDQAAVIIPPVVPQLIMPLAYHSVLSQGITISAVYFDDRKFQLTVADQADGCGSQWLDAESAALSCDGYAAINGGFFTPEGKPLGLLVASGIKRGSLNNSSLGAGIFISSKNKSAIVRREHYASSSVTNNAENLLQAGPMLVEHGKATIGLSDHNERPRSFIAWNGKHHWAIGHIDSSTLAAAAKALSETSLNGFKASTVLNLDGGRSSDLWAGPRVPSGPKTHRSFLNKPVRNYLVITLR
jgi:uncharacterized protein YigE (DUF2233 family)